MNKEIKQNISLSRKTTLIFVAVFVIETFLFIISLSLSVRSLKRESTYSLINNYLESAKTIAVNAGIDKVESIQSEELITVVVYSDGTYDSTKLLDYLSSDEIHTLIDRFQQLQEDYYESSIELPTGTMFYGFVQTENNEIICCFSNGDYLNSAAFNTLSYILILFVVVFVLGDFIIILWMRTLVQRVNRLCDFVSNMPQNNYRNIYIDDGDDEIETLSYKIDEMRRRIVRDEVSKEAMLQNISHDLKTPIAVIRSYAEAIGDGIEDVSKTEIIIEQSLKLDKKVKGLIEFNKLEYSLASSGLDEVDMHPIIDKVVDNYKHMASTKGIEFEVSYDDSRLPGKQENYFTVVENIVENALRYARTIIKIELKEGILSIFNDGDPIDKEFIVNGFRPYEKGHAGKFGLGMSIVAKTLDYFNMSLEVKNENQGVIFIIKPNE